MISNEYEMAIHRKGTEYFIASDPTVIALVPHTEQFTNGTKKSVPQSPREEQVFKVIWGGDTGIVRQTPNGARRFDFILVGKHDAEISIGDKFQNGKATVEYVFPSNGYETKAGGVIHGSA